VSQPTLPASQTVFSCGLKSHKNLTREGFGQGGMKAEELQRTGRAGRIRGWRAWFEGHSGMLRLLEDVADARSSDDVLGVAGVLTYLLPEAGYSHL
jgi:hypothetical protein